MTLFQTFDQKPNKKSHWLQEDGMMEQELLKQLVSGFGLQTCVHAAVYKQIQFICLLNYFSIYVQILSGVIHEPRGS